MIVIISIPVIFVAIITGIIADWKVLAHKGLATAFFAGILPEVF